MSRAPSILRLIAFTLVGALTSQCGLDVFNLVGDLTSQCDLDASVALSNAPAPPRTVPATSPEAMEHISVFHDDMGHTCYLYREYLPTMMGVAMACFDTSTTKAPSPPLLKAPGIPQPLPGGASLYFPMDRDSGAFLPLSGK